MNATLRHWLTLFLLAAVWGSSFILIKRGLYAADGTALFCPLQVGALRISIAGLFLLPIALRKTKLLKFGKIRYFLLAGLCGNAIPAFLFATAQSKIPSSLAGMLNATVPLFSLSIAYFVFRVKIKNTQWLGMLLGLAAAFGLLFLGESIRGKAFNPIYPAMVLIATFLYAVNLNIVKHYLKDQSAVAITSVALMLVMPIGLTVLAFTDFGDKLQTMPGAWSALGAIALLAIFGTALALILFNRLVQETNTLFASSVTYLIPVVAVIWGLLDGETVTFMQVGCIAAMLGGVLLINRG